MNYDAYNNSYGNYAGVYLNECLPNIKGEYKRNTYHHIYNGPNAGYYDDNSALYTKNYAGYRPTHPDSTYGGGISFDANRSNKTYKNDCNAVRVKSYGVYIWQRTS